MSNSSVASMNGSDCNLYSLTQAPMLSVSPTAAEVMRYIQGVYYITAFPIGLLLNVISIVLIAKFKKLHSTSFYLILQVIVADFFNALLLYPVAGANIIANVWVFGSGLCQVLALSLFFLRYARNLLMLVLATDRLCTIFLPFWYARHQVHVVVPMSIVAWFLSFVVALIPVYGILGCYEFQRDTWICDFGNGCSHPIHCSRYRTGSVTVANICIVISLVMYLVLYCKARQLKKRARIVLPLSDNSDHGSSGGSNDSDNSEAVASSGRHQKRATVTYFFLFLALFGVSFPVFLFFVVGSSVISELDIWPPPEGYIITSIITRSMFSLLVIIDPITLMRNADVREAIAQCMKKLRQKFCKY